MKKCKIYLAAIFIMAALFTAYKTWSPEYRICRSFSYSCTDYRETELYVIINRPWGVGETIEKIVTQYNKMNGTPDLPKEVVSKIKELKYLLRYDLNNKVHKFRLIEKYLGFNILNFMVKIYSKIRKG